MAKLPTAFGCRWFLGGGFSSFLSTQTNYNSLITNGWLLRLFCHNLWLHHWFHNTAPCARILEESTSIKIHLNATITDTHKQFITLTLEQVEEKVCYLLVSIKPKVIICLATQKQQIQCLCVKARFNKSKLTNTFNSIN